MPSPNPRPSPLPLPDSAGLVPEPAPGSASGLAGAPDFAERHDDPEQAEELERQQDA